MLNLSYDFHLGAGDNGNVFGITNNKDTTRSQTFTYDALNRLISAQNAGTDCAKKTLNPNQTEYWGNSYGYDAWGNLLAKTITKCSAEYMNYTVAANNQLQGLGYDAAGNMTKDNFGQSYTYDPENRITGAPGYTYTYDGDGNRVQKSNGTTGTLYWYMTPGIVAESDLAGNLQSEYVFLDSERVARKDFPSIAVSYYFSDHLKTATVITDAAGNIKSESDYYPWGGELSFSANDSNHYKFTGKERESETGLDYMMARYYSNPLGRFLTPDWVAKPITVPYADFGNPQSLNLYTYGKNNPTTFGDPDGHFVVGQDDRKKQSPPRQPPQQQQQQQQPESHTMWYYMFHTNTSGTDHNSTGVTCDAACYNSWMAFHEITSLAGGTYAAEAVGGKANETVDVTISRSQSPASAQHIDQAQAGGQPEVVTLDRSGAEGSARAAARGRAARSGTATASGMDRDEYPPKCCAEGGRGASVRPIPSSDNRSAGAQLGNQIRTLPDGTKVRMKTGP